MKKSAFERFYVRPSECVGVLRPFVKCGMCSVVWYS